MFCQTVPQVLHKFNCGKWDIICVLFTCGNRASIHPCPTGLKCTSRTVTQVKLLLFSVAVDPTLPFKNFILIKKVATST